MAVGVIITVARYAYYSTFAEDLWGSLVLLYFIYGNLLDHVCAISG